MHALVTGGGGFLGRYIVEQLVARGDRVRSFSRGEYPELAAMGVEVVRGDLGCLLDREAIAKAVQGVDCVFHVAAKAGVAVGRRTETEFVCTNVGGTARLLAACRKFGIARVVYTSSPSVTFAGVDQCGIDESLPGDDAWLTNNGANYSLSKLAGEIQVLTYNESSMRTCALRPHLIWGPGDGHLIPRLIDRARRGRLRRVGDGTNLVDICYVENAAAAHLAAADALAQPNSPAAGRAYYISQGEPVNCWQWIDQILSLIGLPPVRKSMSFKSASRIGQTCELLYRWLPLHGEPPMTRFLAAQLAKSHWYDISAARRDLGYDPKLSTAEGMRRLGAWLRENVEC
jgi:nucleoside-diphosphate-sugar epimerase